MKVEIIHLGFKNLPKVEVSYKPNSQIVINEDSAFLFPNYFEEIIDGDSYRITQWFKFEIIKNIKHLVAKLYVSGQTINQTHWENSPWNFLNPVRHNQALWRLSVKEVLENGYIVFTKKFGKAWDRAFYDYNLNGPMAAAQRLSTLIGAEYAVALNIGSLVNAIQEIKREVYGNHRYIVKYIAY